MEVSSYTNEQLKTTIQRLERLADTVPESANLVYLCESWGWRQLSVLSISIEFQTPMRNSLFFDIETDGAISGCIVPMCSLDWDEYDGTGSRAQKSRDSFNQKYFEIVSVAEEVLGKPDSTLIEDKPCLRAYIWQKQNALILILQGVEDIDAIDIRLSVKYLRENDASPDLEDFDWLCQRFNDD